jgi:hypothetical protein
MWQHLLMHLHLSTSTLRSLSWSLLALACLLLLAGLYAWNSNVRLLTMLALQLSLNNLPRNRESFESGRASSSVSPELLAQTVTQLAAAYRINTRRVAALCVVFFGIAAVSSWQEITGSSWDMYKNVHVLQRFDTYNFQMEVQDPDTKQWNPFGVTFCQDYEPTSEIQPGVTLTLLKGEYDHRQHCFEVAPKNFGYTILRGDHNVPIVTARRQAAASGETSSY